MLMIWNGGGRVGELEMEVVQYFVPSFFSHEYSLQAT